MAYRKVLVDNTSCSRRFHIAFDDESPAVDHTEIRCNYCSEVVYAKDNHPPIRLAREENLVKMNNLSDEVISHCSFEDKMPKG
jgi:DNA-directed RNA polymerase subunit RPC12/RpoP